MHKTVAIGPRLLDAINHAKKLLGPKFQWLGLRMDCALWISRIHINPKRSPGISRNRLQVSHVFKVTMSLSMTED